MIALRHGTVDDAALLAEAVLYSVVAVCAHPDDESFGLGAVLHSLTSAGASTAVLSFTHGEASSLHGTPGDLRIIRAAELASAADALNVTGVRLLDHPDGELSAVDYELLVDDVVRYARSAGAAVLLAFDLGGISGQRCG